MPSSTSTPCSCEDPELARSRYIIRGGAATPNGRAVQQMEHLVEQFEQFDKTPTCANASSTRGEVVERVVKELLGHPGRAAPKM